MRWLAVLAVVAALMSPTAASVQDYSFGDWARDQGYSPGDVMPRIVDAGRSLPAIYSLGGIDQFDWTTTPTVALWLYDNQISRIEPGDFDGLAYLTRLQLNGNRISSIESDDFDRLTNLTMLLLNGNQLSSIGSGVFNKLTHLRRLGLRDNEISSVESGAFSGLVNLADLHMSNNTNLTYLNLAEADFLSLAHFKVDGNVNIVKVSLASAVVNQTSLAVLLDGGKDDPFRSYIGIGELDGITEMDLSGIDFVDITDLEPLYVMDDLTDLWLVDTKNLDAADLDVLLDNLATIESDANATEGILYMTQADFDAFNTAGGGLLAAWDAEPGHHVELVSYQLLGDVNLDGEVNGLDVDPFVEVLLSGPYQLEADMNDDQVINGLDVDSFVEAVVGGGTQSVPEPSTLLLALIALGVVGGWRKWKHAA